VIKKLHQRKTDIFMELIEARVLPLRPGVQRLVQEALSRSIPTVRALHAMDTTIYPVSAGGVLDI
jgi:hypothetical protein